MWCFVSLFLIVSTSAVDCLERLVFKMTCYVLSGMLNLTHSLTHCADFGALLTETCMSWLHCYDLALLHNSYIL